MKDSVVLPVLIVGGAAFAAWWFFVREDKVAAESPLQPIQPAPSLPPVEETPTPVLPTPVENGIFTPPVERLPLPLTEEEQYFMDRYGVPYAPWWSPYGGIAAPIGDAVRGAWDWLIWWDEPEEEVPIIIDPGIPDPLFIADRPAGLAEEDQYFMDRYGVPYAPWWSPYGGIAAPIGDAIRGAWDWITWWD